MLTINSDKLKIEVRKHIEMEDGRRKGGFIGCLAHSRDIRLLAEKYGFAPVFVRLVEDIQESLPQKKRVRFFSDIGENMRDGVDTEMVVWTALRKALERRPFAPETATVIGLLKRVEAGENRHELRSDFDDAHKAAGLAARRFNPAANAAFSAAGAARIAGAADDGALAAVLAARATALAATADAATERAAERDLQAADVITAIKNARCETAETAT